MVTPLADYHHQHFESHAEQCWLKRDCKELRSECRNLNSPVQGQTSLYHQTGFEKGNIELQASHFFGNSCNVTCFDEYVCIRKRQKAGWSFYVVIFGSRIKLTWTFFFG
jgi:hypothetical protein